MRIRAAFDDLFSVKEMIDFNHIIYKYYPVDNELRHILIAHSRAVADFALNIIEQHPELCLDRRFVEEAAMLHDIGIFQCDAPGIQCFGTQPYILHGRLGAELLRSEGLEKHARVCERHTGAGITIEQICTRNLLLPKMDFLPETLEEKLICYSDKFFSKTHLEKEKTVEEAKQSLSKFGVDGLARFDAWHKLFG